MKKTILACALMAVASSAAAKEKIIPLDEADAAALKGKTVAMTVHERPSFDAMTAGKASFGLFGAAAMISAGNKLVDENHIADPAAIVRDALSAALRDARGATLLPADSTPTKATKPKDIAATHPDADYVFDVRSAGWMFAYFPTSWSTYWVGYSAQVQLVDTKTGRQVSNAACNTNTRENPHPPSLEQLKGNGAQLLKDVTTSLGWTCVQLLAKEQFHFSGEEVAATPAEYADPLAALAGAASATAGAPAPQATEAATGESGDAPQSADGTR